MRDLDHLADEMLSRMPDAIDRARLLQGIGGRDGVEIGKVGRSDRGAQLEYFAATLGTFEIRDQLPHYFPRVDARFATRLNFLINNSTDVVMGARVMGAYAPDESTEPYRITGTVIVAEKNSQESLIVNIEESWHPYFTVLVRATVSVPTTGRVDVVVYIVRWVPPKW